MGPTTQRLGVKPLFDPFETLFMLLLIAVVAAIPILTIVNWFRLRRLEGDVKQLRSQLRRSMVGQSVRSAADLTADRDDVEQPDDSIIEDAGIWLEEVPAEDEAFNGDAARQPKPQSEGVQPLAPFRALAAAAGRVQAGSILSREVPGSPTAGGLPAADAGDERPTFEELLAGKWLTWVGAIAVIIGAGFFFKYTIDAKLLGPTGRVVVGIIVGMSAFAGGAYAMLRNYRFLAQGLVGAAVGILYFSLFAAFQWYGIIPESAAFIGMLCVTTAALAFSTIFDAQATAILGLLGGFLTPTMLSTGTDHQWILFAYVFLLDLGVLGIATFRKWQPLQLTALIGSLFIWLVWFDRHYAPEKLTSTVILMTAFFLLFALLGVWHNIVRRVSAVTADFFLILATPVMYFMGLYWVTEFEYSFLHGLMAVAIAGAYLALALFALARDPAGKKVVIALGGIAASFLTIAIPLQLTGHWIAIAWAAESLLLVELGLRFNEAKLRLAGFGLLAFVQLVLVFYGSSTFFNPNRFQTRFTRVDPVVTDVMPGSVLFGRGRSLETEPTWTDVFNGRSFSFFASAIVMSILAWEYRRRFGSVESDSLRGIDTSTAPTSVQTTGPPWRSVSPGQASAWLMAGVPLTVLALLIVETFAMGHRYHWIFPTYASMFSVWSAVIALVLMGLSLSWGPRWLDRVGLAVFGLLGMFLFANTLGSLSGWRNQWRRLVADGYEDSIWNWMLINPRGVGFLFAVASAAIAAHLFRSLERRADAEEEESDMVPLGAWDRISVSSAMSLFAILTGLAMLTVEVYAQGVIRDWRTGTSLAITGVWTVFAIATLVSGIYYRSAGVRVLSLLLFLLTTGKVFLYDVWHLDRAIRTIAFVGLGLSLLLVSYLYQRYRDRIRTWITPLALLTAFAGGFAIDAPVAIAAEVRADEASEVDPLKTLRKRWPVQGHDQEAIDRPPRRSDEFLQIVLPPEIYGVARRDLGDLRIFAVNEPSAVGIEVPFVVRRARDRSTVQKRPAPILNLSQLNGTTQFLLDLSDAVEPVNELIVEISNVERNYERPVKVFAAERRDAEDWNLLSDDGYLLDRTRPEHRLTVSRITFPQSRFHFYKVVIDNLGQRSLKVSGARLFDRTKFRAGRREFATQIISRENLEKEKSTEIMADLGYDRLPIVGLQVEAEFDGAYYRTVTLESTDKLEEKTKWHAVTSAQIYRIERRGMKRVVNDSLEFGEATGRFIRLTISNADDQPLHINKLTALGIDRILVAEKRRVLDSGDYPSVALYAGDAKLNAPSYDLARTIGDIELDEVELVPLVAVEDNPFFSGPRKLKLPWSEENKALLWTATICGVLILGAMTFLILKQAASTGSSGDSAPESEK